MTLHDITLHDITWHYMTKHYITWHMSGGHNKPRHDTFSWMFAFGRRIVGGSASEWRPWLALAWPLLETGDVLSDTSALTRARMNWLGIQNVEARHNFVDFRWQSMWQCQVVQCFSVAQIKSPSPVYGWWWGEEILRVQTIYTPPAQIGFSSQFKCVLLYTFYGVIMIPE